jgi:predicted metalloprotease
MKVRESHRAFALAVTVALAVGGGSASAQSPSPEAVLANAGGCAGTLEVCMREALVRAAARAAGLDTSIRVEPPTPFQGGQRQSSRRDYLADTISLVDGYWQRSFGPIPYTPVASTVMPEGSAPVLSNCRAKDGTSAPGGPDIGPFYCPVGGALTTELSTSVGAIYIGVPALEALVKRVGLENEDFPYVAVVAHEMGHHVEHLLIGGEVPGWSKTTETWAELGADCLAGVFAKAAYYGKAGQLEAGDYEEATTLFYAIGNDLPYSLHPRNDPHGTKEQRQAAFVLGYESSSAQRCLSEEWPTS